MLADDAWADKRGLAPTARLVSYGIAAVEPGMFGLGPVPAVKQALQRAGWDICSIERAEINEAFASIATVVRLRGYTWAPPLPSARLRLR